ncbi:response regulator [Anaerolineales bacterium HSG25]|nr:response regulator [Anaerolineales bacterium HSG25]
MDANHLPWMPLWYNFVKTHYTVISDITQPLQTLTSAAEQIQAGDLTVHAQVTSGDEIGQLADTFNSMTANLRQTRDDLEDRQQALRQQNKYLNSTAELSERLSAILNIDELLMELVNQLQTQFDYYHVHVYLLDESSNMLVMTAGIGTAGATMKEQGHAIALVIGYKGARRKALVVDDKDYNRSVLVSMLEPLGFEIIIAKNGQEAIEQTKTHQPDMVLMDMIMPIMTGFEATQIIRETPSLQKTVIIGASASAFEKDKERVRLAGCDAFLAKPLRTTELCTIVRGLRLWWSGICDSLI